jgi:hypothetical protein
MTNSFEARTPDAGSRFAERRVFPRFPFVAGAEMTDPLTKAITSGRVTEISQSGCFAEISNQPAAGSVIQLRVQKDEDAFETWALVVYNRPRLGSGLRFIDTPPDQLKLLISWLDRIRRN